MLGHILARKFPALIPGVDWVVRQDAAGQEPYLDQWNSTTTARPTNATLAQWKSEYDPTPTADEKMQRLEFTKLTAAHTEILWARANNQPAPLWALALLNEAHDRILTARS